MADLTPNNREELWLQGMVDGQTTLEPNKRREYWYKEIVDAIGSGGGGGTGGGGSSTFIISVAFDTEVGDYNADKTFSDIGEAISDGQVPVVYYSYDIDGYANLGRVTPSTYEFFLFSMNGTKVVCHNIIIDALNNVTVNDNIQLN